MEAKPIIGPETKTIILEGQHGQCRLVISDRGSYQHVAHYNKSGLIGEFAYSADDRGVFECWTLHGEGMTLRQLQEIGIS